VAQHHIKLKGQETEVAHLKNEVHRLQEVIEHLGVPKPVKGTDTIETAWCIHEKAKEVFSRYHLNSCHQCSVRFDETIQEAADAYGFSEEAILVELNLLGREAT